MGRIFRWTLLFVVLVIFASGGVALYTVFFSTEDDVLMPSLRDKSVEEAVNEANKMGLAVKIDQIFSTLPPGRVLAQYPEPGSQLRKDRAVILQVSKGGSRRPVPDVRGLDLAKAQGIIQEQGFEVGDIIDIKDNSRPGGAIIAQSPAAPANVPTDKKIALLVSQGGPNNDGRVGVPDVANMSEREARSRLSAGGIKVADVDYVYSPNAVEGRVIGTRPSAGSTVRSGGGVFLKVATTRKPETPTAANKPATGTGGAAPTAGTGGETRGVVVKVPGHEDVFIGDGSSVPRETDKIANSNVTVLDQQRKPTATPAPGSSVRPATITPPKTTDVPTAGTTEPLKKTEQPAQPKPVQPNQQNLQPTGGKIAKIRYQVPPLARPLQLRIELVDPNGKKVVLDREAKSGEYISIDSPYSKECAVTISLGGEFVWQDKYM